MENNIQGFNITTYHFSSSRTVRDTEYAQKKLREGLDNGWDVERLGNTLSIVAPVVTAYFTYAQRPIRAIVSAFVGWFGLLLTSSKNVHLGQMRYGADALGDLAYYMERNNIEAVEVDFAYSEMNHNGERIRYFSSSDYILKRIKKDGRWMLLG